MLRQENIIRIGVIMAIISWLVTLGSIYLTRFAQIHSGPTETYEFFSKVFLIIFIISVYFFYRNTTSSQGGFNITDLLWRVFVTGMVATIVSLTSNFLLNLLRNNELSHNPYFIDTIYHINTGLITTFLIAAFAVWKRLILYQKTKWLVRFWSIFEYGLLGSAVMFFINTEMLTTPWIIYMTLLTLLGLVLGVNLKWVAYLNFKQKWKSILLILLIGLYIGYFFVILNRYGDNNAIIPTVNVLSLGIIGELFIFTFGYCVYSILVILFNLPTTSVFEQKLVEVVNFQKLSQSRNTGQSEEQVFYTLLDSSVSVTLANAAWLDIMNEQGQLMQTLYHQITSHERKEVLKYIEKSGMKPIQSSVPARHGKQNRFVAELRHDSYKSIVVIPLFIQDQYVASIALLKDVNEGFSKEMIEIIRTFINQASISIENHRLLMEAIVNERYKEELKIAKRVQEGLMPKALHTNCDLEISTFSKAAAEVGGDYFDTYKISDERLAIIVGDVSGKGTSAAFHMSQMKGIFHSLVQLNLPIHEFIIKANNALSECLDRTSFITIAYFIIDSEEKTFRFSRAGHCPTLYYSAQENQVKFLEDNGLGLGILRDRQFDSYVEVNEISYHSGDILVLYTDGITEAKNSKNEEFGYERLKWLFEDKASLGADEIKEAVVQGIYDFCGSNVIEDDVTLLVIKVK